MFHGHKNKSQAFLQLRRAKVYISSEMGQSPPYPLTVYTGKRPCLQMMKKMHSNWESVKPTFFWNTNHRVSQTLRHYPKGPRIFQGTKWCPCSRCWSVRKSWKFDRSQENCNLTTSQDVWETGSQVNSLATWMSCWKLGSMVRINGLFHLLITYLYMEYCLGFLTHWS